MVHKLSVAIAFCFTAVFAGSAAAAEVFIYPQKGQSAEQQEKDKFECYNWAKQNSGFDPMAAPTATRAAPQAEEKKGGVGRGLLGGAAGGAIIGAIAGDAGKGAAIGAATGGLFGGMRRHNQKEREQNAQQQWKQEQVANYTQSRNNYNRAYAACLDGRGYTVK